MSDVDLLRRVLIFLSPVRLRYLQKRYWDRDDPCIPNKIVWLLAIHDWLTHLGDSYVSDDQQNRIVDWIKPALPDDPDAAQGILWLALADGRYATVTGRDSWYDYQLDEPVSMLPRPAVTHIACDLVRLWQQTKERRQALRGSTCE